MKKITGEEIKKAFYFWRAKYEPREDEESLTPFLDEKIISFTVNQQGWLKKVRRGLFLSSSTVAKKLDIARAAYSKYEEGEETGSITLATLARAAEAMDCELVYAIRLKIENIFQTSFGKNYYRWQ